MPKCICICPNNTINRVSPAAARVEYSLLTQEIMPQSPPEPSTSKGIPTTAGGENGFAGTSGRLQGLYFSTEMFTNMINIAC